MYEHFILWTEDQRCDSTETRKVILEFDDPFRLKEAVDYSLFDRQSRPLDSIRRYLQGSLSTFTVYLGVDDFEKEFGSSIVYRMKFIPPPKAYVYVVVEENRFDDDRFVSDVHYVWNRMFELGFLVENKLPLGDKEVHPELYLLSAFSNPHKLLISPPIYDFHVFGAMLMLEALVDKSLREGFQRVR